MKTLFFSLLTSVIMLSAQDNNPNRNFQVSLNGCREFVGFGPVSAHAAQTALPPGFTAALIGPDGGVVIRASACDTASVAGSTPRPAIVAHYGINIVSPDGTGDINNYTLSYATNSEALADRLRKTGLPVVYNASLSVEDPAVKPGNVYVAAWGEDLPPWFVTGMVSGPQAPAFPFLANWWYQSKTGRLKMSTNIPAIAFGSAALVLNTGSDTELGRLIGGNQKSNFPFYNVRGQFLSGIMTVTTTR